jgi:hypothetical protein
MYRPSISRRLVSTALEQHLSSNSLGSRLGVLSVANDQNTVIASKASLTGGSKESTSRWQGAFAAT